MKIVVVFLFYRICSKYLISLHLYEEEFIYLKLGTKKVIIILVIKKYKLMINYHDLIMSVF